MKGGKRKMLTDATKRHMEAALVLAKENAHEILDKLIDTGIDARVELALSPDGPKYACAAMTLARMLQIRANEAAEDKTINEENCRELAWALLSAMWVAGREAGRKEKGGVTNGNQV